MAILSAGSVSLTWRSPRVAVEARIRRVARGLRLRWAQTSLVTRVTLWYTLLLAAVVTVVGVVVAGSLLRWIEANTLSQLSTQGQEVRLALTAAAQSGQPFQASTMHLLSEISGRDVQASVWAVDGRLIARSEGFYFPQEKFFAGAAAAADAVKVQLPDAAPSPGQEIFVARTLPIAALPAQPALASGDVIGQLSNRLYMNTVSGSVSDSGPNRVAILIMPLEGVPDDLVATSDAYPDVPPLTLPTSGFASPAPRQAFIALTSSLNREAEAVSNVLSIAAVVGTLMLVLGAFIARRIVRHSLRPVDELAGASQRLAAGDLTTRVPIPPGKDEIGRLARSFNDMAFQLDSAFAAQRAFVADASHELRTPLAALRGQVDVMRRALPEQPTDADRLASSMRRELARLSRLVDDLLVLARLDSLGSGALALRWLDVCSVAEDVSAQVSALPSAKGREVRLETPSGPVRISADGERLHQVLLNLLANAVEHTPPGGSATLSVEASVEGAHVVVRDTGPGIPSSHLPNIFDRFYRVDGTRRRLDGGGAGLGLSIARAIVDAHGGTISASNAPQSGAIFTVDIPSQP